MNFVFSLLLSGSILGLTLGVSPSPLLTLAVTQTLTRGFKEGCKVVSVPVITDLPLLLATIFLYSRIPNLSTFLGIVSLLGGAFIAYLGYKYIVIKAVILENKASLSNSFKQGILTNLLNPNPYIFWFTVGGTTVTNALNENPLAALAFLLSFFGILIFSRFVIVFAVSKSAQFIKGKAYLIIIKLLGFIMLIFAFRFIMNGLKYFI